MIIPARYLQADLTESLEEDVAFNFTDVNCQAGKGLHLWYLITDSSIHSKRSHWFEDERLECSQATTLIFFNMDL